VISLAEQPSDNWIYLIIFAGMPAAIASEGISVPGTTTAPAATTA
jgi:hypothetical protein